MSKLKELTWENHQKAERTSHARKLLKGMTPEEYHRYLYNQHIIYSALETQASGWGVLVGIEDIKRAQHIKRDIEELEKDHQIQGNPELVCPVVNEYVSYIMNLTDYNRLLAHIYVRHFGDMYGGQMIAKRNPGSGHMYNFENVKEIEERVRSRLKDEMADEANRCFEFAMQLFEELENE